MPSHERSSDLSPAEMKALIKEAHKEWLDEKWNEVNAWIARAFLMALFLVVVKVMLAVNGYKLVAK